MAASLAAAEPCVDAAAVLVGETVNAGLAVAAVAVDGVHALARQFETAAAQFGDQLGGIAASGGAVEFLAFDGAL